MEISRRGFLATAAAAAGGAFADNPVRPNLTLGVLSDIHIHTQEQVPVFEKALAFFRDAGVDGVVIAGDMADTGLVHQLEKVAAAWFKVFPDNKAPDGRTVEKLFVYGNHDVSDYADGELKSKGLDPKDWPAHKLVTDRKANWERILREPWQGVYAKQVKGYVFVGAHWGYEKQLDAFLQANADRLGLRNGKPFFYAQHPHPGNTVQGPWAWGHDGGVATAALSKFPNAVAFSGHSHYSLTDDRCVWQGAFTSIGTSSLRYIFSQYGRENGEDCEWARSPVRQMPNLDEHEGKQGQVVRVYGDSLLIERREFVYGEKLGPDWIVPLDGSKAFAFETRAAKMVAPEFAPGAKVSLSAAVGKNRKGVDTPQVTVSFPAAKPSATSRVLDYEVRALAYTYDVDHEVASKRVHAEKFYLAPAREAKSGTCVFALSELPAGKTVRFAVRPVECYGKKGHEIVSAPWKVSLPAGAIPAWAEQEIAAAVARYNAWKGADTTVAFTVITDVHSRLVGLGDSVDWSDSLAHQILAQKAAARAGCDFLADLGDHDFQVGPKDQAEVDARLATTQAIYAENPRPVLFALGNHDHGDPKKKTFVSSARFGETFNGLMAKHGHAFKSGANKSWGYLDLPAKRTRVFVLNSSDEGYYGYSKAQLQFVADNLKLAPGWTAAVCQHFCIQTKAGYWIHYENTRAGRQEVFIKMVEDFVARRAGSADGVAWDFTKNVDTRFAGCFFGDSHYDNHLLENGVHYTITQGYGGVGDKDFPKDNGAVKTPFNRGSQMLVDLVAFKPATRELKVFRIGAGGPARDRGYSY